jgi:hypothetical protein
MRNEPSTTQTVSDEQLQNCVSDLTSISQALPSSDSTNLKLVQDEIRNAARMSIHGVHRLLSFRNNAVKKQQLDADISKIIAEHERLWLARNAPGGLRESVQHLANTIEPWR